MPVLIKTEDGFTIAPSKLRERLGLFLLVGSASVLSFGIAEGLIDSFGIVVTCSVMLAGAIMLFFGERLYVRMSSKTIESKVTFCNPTIWTFDELMGLDLEPTHFAGEWTPKLRWKVGTGYSLGTYSMAEAAKVFAQAAVITGLQIHYRSPREAIRCLNEGLKREPNSTEILLVRGIAFSQRRHAYEACADFSKVLETEPACISALFNRMILRMKHGQYEAALQDCERMEIKEEGDHAWKALMRSRLLANLKRREEAVKEIESISEKEIEKNPKRAVLLNQRAYIFLVLDLLERAKADYEQTVKLLAHLKHAGLQSDFDGLIHRANALMGLDRCTEAELDMNEVMRISHVVPETKLYRASLHAFIAQNCNEREAEWRERCVKSCLELLEECHRARVFSCELEVSPELACVHGDPLFKKMMEETRRQLLEPTPPSDEKSAPAAA